VSLARAASAQTFPGANAYVPLPCGAGVMVDAVNDTPGASGPLDIVGTTAQPAGFHAADANYLYMRMRVASTPEAGTKLIANAWGWEFDLDGDLHTYELLISANGITNTDMVSVYRNTKTTIPDSPDDPADQPAVFTYAFATNGQAIPAGSTLGGGQDYFIDVAVPWADLNKLQVVRNTPVYVWEGTSTVPDALDLDIACYGGPAGSAQLSGIDVTVIAPDPTVPPGPRPGPGGGGGNGQRTLEGGPGCAIAGAPANDSALLLLSVVMAALARLLRARRSL
jgi:hypothetical protein